MAKATVNRPVLPRTAEQAGQPSGGMTA